MEVVLYSSPDAGITAAKAVDLGPTAYFFGHRRELVDRIVGIAKRGFLGQDLICIPGYKS